DLRGLRPAFEAALGTAEPMGEWFARMLHGSLVANHVRAFRPFGTIGVEALGVVAARRGIRLDESAAAGVVAGMR
ncbi:MAG: haloacid dehalogenase type II, partial [Actinobacteria bacterium]|nr:haloacid dehalogenase type II [Actinomycetota bacterium]NIS37422.1 haloacid dehalogenase type II [Actinomycetota bacterium]NIU22461.1 haloacid dehalogenase type II [Actinomycetota bacterium]NIU71849.1 haloacid dehalogenase type II [Actinomycetota bacterium]NIV91111.1 haloacid dehalogenase type II [Actinomycetota bacterium]